MKWEEFLGQDWLAPNVDEVISDITAMEREEELNDRIILGDRYND